MKILSPAENKIIVELSAADMQELDIDYEQMDYASVNTRRVIWALLEKAGAELGWDIDPSRRMLIEAVPEMRGGCMFCFTLLEGEQGVALRVKSQNGPEEKRVFCFENENALLDALGAVQKHPSAHIKGRLFCENGAYRLAAEQCSESALMLASEYADRCKAWDACIPFIEEHWQPAGRIDI